MTTDPKRVVVTGAAGFLGGHVVRALLADPRFAGARLTLVDLRRPPGGHDARVEAIEGDLADPAVADRVFDGRVDVLAHLAGVLGGAAGRDPARARQVNVDSTLAILDRLGDPARPPRVVYASSVAVYGALPALVTDATPAHPESVYGRQKREAERALEARSAQGRLDGLALRLPAVVARPAADGRLGSAFLSDVFHAVATGADIVVPVAPDGVCWLLSVRAAADAVVHAAMLDPHALGPQRSILTPLLAAPVADLVAALRRRFPHSPSRVTYDPDPARARFAHHPPARTALAQALGFTGDGTLDRLVERALGD